MNENQEEELWQSEEESDCSDNEVALDRSNTLPLPFQQLFIFVFMRQFVYHVSNSAVTCPLKFMKYFIRAIGTAFHCKGLVDVTDSMPLSLQTVHHMLGVSGEAFISYVVCPSAVTHSLAEKSTSYATPLSHPPHRSASRSAINRLQLGQQCFRSPDSSVTINQKLDRVLAVVLEQRDAG